MVLDHLIAVVPDLQASHRRLREMGFDEAWPPGPFWPSAITSGIALGGANLELYQRAGDELEEDLAGAFRTHIGQLVMAPTTVEEGRAMLEGERFAEAEKEEGNPELLTLRGFPPERTHEPQAICHNLYPANPPYPFFLCVYAPFLKARLSPENFATPHGPLVGLVLTAPDPEAVRRLFAGRLGPIELSVDEGPAEVVEIRFADGFALTIADL